MGKQMGYIAELRATGADAAFERYGTHGSD